MFDTALELDVDARPAFINRQCAGDAALQYEVRHLLRMNEEIGSLPDRTSPAFERVTQDMASTLLFVPGDIVADRFTIVKFLGRGGMGEVYEAEDRLLSDRVALKVMRPGTSTPGALAERFRREVRLARKVTHPGVCRVHDVAVHSAPSGELIVLTMELVHGETLAARLARGRLEPADALDLASQLGRALDAAHREQILHRDIKPANVLLEPRGEDVRAVLTDFGVARALGPDASTHPTGIGIVIGTPRYMAPEQFRGAEPSKRSDLYSFGVVLYEMVTGTHPYSDDPVEPDLARRHVEPPRPVSDLAPDLARVWDKVLTRALDPDPAKRFESCAQLLEALSPPQAMAARRRSNGRRALELLAIAVLVGIVAAVAVGRLWTLQAAPLTDKDTIVLADFVNTTGDPVFDDTLKQGLTIQLRQSPFLSILADQKLRETLKLMGRAPGDALTPPLARDACVRTSSKAMLTGSIARLGSQYVVGLRAVECYTGADLAQEQERAGRKEDVLKALDKAATRVRSTLGESLSTVEKYDAPVERTTTPSLEALQAYTLSLTAFLQKGDAASVVLLKRAIDLDPEFAMAHVALAESYRNLGEGDLSRQYFTKAYALKERASEREQYRITTEYFNYVTGELEKANLVYEQWGQVYPRDKMPFGGRALNRMSVGAYEEARTNLLEAIRLSPDWLNDSANLIYVYLALNRSADARALCERWIARLPNRPRLHIHRYAIAFMDGDAAEMRRQAEQTIGHPGDEDMQLSFESETQAYGGRLAQARDLSRRAVTVADRNDQHETAALWLLNAAVREAEVGNAQMAREQTTAVLRRASSPDLQILAALAFARSGSSQRALELADEIGRQLPRDTMVHGYWLPVIRASAALSRNDAPAALELLRTSRVYELGGPLPSMQMGATLYPVYVRGEASLKAGRGPEAAAEFQKIIDHRGIVLNFIVGALAHLQLGRAQAISGDREAARKTYDTFFTLWKDADPDVPILKAARLEYSRLR